LLWETSSPARTMFRTSDLAQGIVVTCSLFIRSATVKLRTLYKRIYIYIYIYIWSAIAANNFFILQVLTTCFGPYGPSSGENVSTSNFVFLRRPSHYNQFIHCFHDYVAYLLLLKLTVFYILQLFLVSLKYIIQVDIKMYIKCFFY
jgi:hypothetical protein